MPPSVSVIVPFYNREATLLDAVRSVLNQTHSSFELLLVDDASTDASFSLVNALNDERIRIIRHDHNKGAAAARNTGIKAAQAPLVAFLDSDDVWHANKLEKHVAFHLSAGVPVTCTSFSLTWESGQKSVRRLDPKTQWRQAFLYGCHVGPGSTMMADRAVFERVGYLDESLKRLEDWDWFLRLVRNEDFSVLDEVLSDVRVSGYPAYQPVLEACQKLKELHEPYLSKRSSKDCAIFLSGLQIECAYISFHNYLYKKMGQHLFKAVMASPAGFAHFLGRTARSRLSFFNKTKGIA